MESLWRDIRYGVRMLGRNPGFTIVAVVTLALGIGAITAIFSVIYSLMFRPLPVKDAEQLVSLAVIQGDSFPSQLSYPDYRDYRAMKEIFSGVIAYNATLTQLSAEGGSPERALFTVVSGNYFEVLGLEAVVGRTFSPEEREQMGAGNVIVLSYGFWQRRFAGDPNIAGTPVKLSGKPFTIIGVAPESFPGTYGLIVTDGYIPLTAGDSLSVEFRKSLEDRSDNGYRVIARLQPGVSLEQARAAVAVQAKRLEQEYPDSNKGVRALVHPEPMARMEPSAVAYLPPCGGLHDPGGPGATDCLRQRGRPAAGTRHRATKGDRHSRGPGGGTASHCPATAYGEYFAFLAGRSRRTAGGAVGHGRAVLHPYGHLYPVPVRL